MKDFRNFFYENYIDLKGWHNLPDPITPFIFEEELKHTDLKGVLSILEIGFGRGDFLRWGRSKGHHMVGIEIIPKLVEDLKNEGFEVYQQSATSALPKSSLQKKYDLIVIFDVLEHLYPDEIIILLNHCRDSLDSHGKILCRFPNSASPFGWIQFLKDITHITPLSVDRMEQLAACSKLEIFRSGNSPRVLKGKKFSWFLRVVYSVRNIYECWFGYLYFRKRIPLDPNITAVLQHNKQFYNSHTS